jgi:hypothetical protein
LAINDSKVVNEDDAHNWNQGAFPCRQWPVPLLPGLFVRGGGHRRRRQGNASGRRTRAKRRTLHRLRQVHERPAVARDRRYSRRQAAAEDRHSDVGVARGRAGQRRFAAAARPRPAICLRRNADGRTDVAPGPQQGRTRTRMDTRIRRRLDPQSRGLLRFTN